MLITCLTYIVLFPCVLYAVIKRNIFSAFLLFVMCFFQNFYITLVSPYINHSGYILLLLVKEIYIVLLIFAAIIQGKRFSKLDIYALACIILLLILSIVHSQGSLTQVLASFRQMYVTYALYLFARCITVTEKQYVRLVRWYIKLCLICVVFGVIELVIGDSFWERLNYGAYMMLKYGYVSYRNGYINATGMYSWDLSFLTGGMIRRMSSFLVDPVILSQIFALAFLILLFCKNLFKHQEILTIIIGFGLVATLGKGGIIISCFGGAILLNRIYKKKQLSMYLLISAFMIFMAGLFVADIFDSGAMNHIDGLVIAFKNWPNHIFGTGIGSNGGLALMLGEVEAESASESFIAAVISQIGIAVLIFPIFYGKFYKMVEQEKKLNKNVLVISSIEISNIALIIVFITSFINNAAISFTSLFAYFILTSSRIKPNIGLLNPDDMEE